MKKNQTKTAVNKNSKNFYAFGTYKPNKNAVPVTYNGKTYLSKAQCMALEGITRKELDAYLKGEPVPEVAQEIEEETTVGATEEELDRIDEQDEDLVNLDDIIL